MTTAINEDLARRAHDNMSMTDYEPGSATRQFEAMCAGARELADAAIARAPHRADEAEHIYDRYRERTARYVNEDSRIGAMCPSVMIAGPANFPTQQKKRQAAAWEKLHGELDKLEALKGKLRRIGTAAKPVKAGDADAVGRLEKRLAKRRADQDEMKRANRYIRMKDERKGDEGLAAMGYSAERIAELRKGDFCGRKSYPAYMLANNNAEIHRLEKRIAALGSARESAAPNRDTAIAGEPCTVAENADAMRLQVFFEGKPSEECRTALKSAGFRWAPSQSAWQRQLTDNARRALRRIEAV